MGSKSYRVRALVVGKTKLGESDVIVTLMSEDGSCIRAVAKGARKPGGAFASRLELCCLVDALVAQGKNLDIVQEARTADAHVALRTDAERMLCAAPIAELLAKTMQEGLENPKLFPLANAALEALDDATPSQALALCAAALLKVMAYLGFKPSLDACIRCGAEIPLVDPHSTTFFSYLDGGSVCPDCHQALDVITLDTSTIAWAHAFLYATFDEIADFEVGENTIFAILQLARQWVAIHAGVRLKSLDYLMTSGVFEFDPVLS